MLAASHSFGLHSLPGTAMLTGIGGAIFIAAMAALLIFMALGLRRVRFELESDGLRIRAPFYGRRIAKSMLKLDEAKVLDSENDLTGFGRSNAVGLPGYRVGWFKNKARKEKALFYVTDRKQVLSIPTTEGYTLYLNADDPNALLTALKGSGGGSTIPMKKSGAWPLFTFLPMGILLLVLAGSFVYFVVGPKRLTVGDRSVDVSGSFYGTSVARDQVVTDQARVVDLDHDVELRPGSRTNGVDLLGYQEGWFKLHNGEKAFVVRSGSKAVYLPTKAGFSILFTPPDPAAVIASLH